MTRIATLLVGIGAIAATLAAALPAQQPAGLAQVQPGLWEVTGVPGSSAPIRLCVGDIAALARFEHRSRNCSARILHSAGSRTAIEYSCGGAGFGRSDIEVITPRSLRIGTQGISEGLPFNYVLQAHRIDDCAKSALSARH
jgi:hypothetical protein